MCIVHKKPTDKALLEGESHSESLYNYDTGRLNMDFLFLNKKILKTGCKTPITRDLNLDSCANLKFILHNNSYELLT